MDDLGRTTIGRHPSSATGIAGLAGRALTPEGRCPKHMVFGPCGGVRADESCELDPALRCPFVDRPLPIWPGVQPVSAPTVVPRVMTDLRVRAYDAPGIGQVAAVLGAAADAVLIGEHQNRPDFPPAFVAALVSEAGAVPWPVLTCRDRNRIALDSELAALSALGVQGVHCVTGDGANQGSPRAGRGVFELDSLQLSALAVDRGLSVSVAGTPTAPPIALRPQRLVDKERTGASICIINHAGGSAGVQRYVDAARAAGSTMRFVACVPIFTDARSAAVLTGFPGAEIDPALVREVVEADDPVEAGIAAAVREALVLLASGTVEGVDLSGSGTVGDELGSAEILAEAARRVKAGAAA